MDDLRYSVRRSSRARRVLVTVDASAGVEVVLPKRAAEREAAAAIAELRPWIEKRLRRGGTLLRRPDDPRSADALGELLRRQPHELQLATAPCAGGSRRLRGV